VLGGGGRERGSATKTARGSWLEIFNNALHCLGRCDDSHFGVAPKREVSHQQRASPTDLRMIDHGQAGAADDFQHLRYLEHCSLPTCVCVCVCVCGMMVVREIALPLMCLRVEALVSTIVCLSKDEATHHRHHA
jgi:hypothetical protein